MPSVQAKKEESEEVSKPVSAPSKPVVSDDTDPDKAAADTNDGIDDNVSLMTQSKLDGGFVHSLKRDSVDQFLQIEANKFTDAN